MQMGTFGLLGESLSVAQLLIETLNKTTSSRIAFLFRLGVFVVLSELSVLGLYVQSTPNLVDKVGDPSHNIQGTGQDKGLDNLFDERSH